MGILLERLAERKLLVSDGAWGTMLQAAGMAPGVCPETWNVTHPDEIKAVASAYAEAGADVVLTNTFGGNRIKLGKMNEAERVDELNEAGARLSIEAAPSAVVAASLGSTGEYLEPLGEMTAEEIAGIFREQIAALVRGGGRAICIETMTAIDEAVCAVRAAREVDASLDIVATMMFDAGPAGYHTMMGVSCKQAAEELAEAGANIIGSNCGNGPEGMIEIVGDLRAASGLPILVHANAGLPELRDGETIFPASPEAMAACVSALVEAGAVIIGGCCGTTPAHISAIREAVDLLRS